MPIETALTELFGIRHPIVLAPMGGVTGGRLAQAVSAAGGLGLIGGGYGDPDWLKSELAAAGNAPVGVGFITWHLAKRPETLDLALARSPKAVMLSFGDAAPFAGKIKAAGAKLICQVQTVPGAHEAMRWGADVIVAQGSEAGGHGASRGTLSLVPAVVDAVHPTPVLAAGGIADGRGLAAALSLGAAGALIGTRFYATPEALGAEAIKRRIVEATGDDTARTRVFDIVRHYPWPQEFTGRAIRNAFLERWHGREAALEAALEGEVTRYEEAVRKDDVATRVIFAGEAIDLIHEIEPAGVLVERIVAEAEAILARLGLARASSP